MTPEEKDVIIKLSCIIYKSCFDPNILRQHGVLGDTNKYRGWKNAMNFLLELLQEVLDEKKGLPTIVEVKRILEEAQKQKGLHDKK